MKKYIQIKKFLKPYFYKIQKKVYILFELFSFSKTIFINDQKFFLPYISGCILKVDEPWMVEVVKKSISIKTGLFVDIGANLGQTLLALKSINSYINYLGIEPNYFALNYLNELIKINKLQNKTHILPGALTRKEGFSNLDFYNPILSDSTASIIQKFRTDEIVEYSQEVPNVSSNKLKNIVLNKKISTIKIDVEGAEYQCIKSLKDLIIKNKPFIIVEILPVFSLKNKERYRNQRGIFKYLTSIEYICFRIIKNKKNKLSHYHKLNDIEIHSNLSFCDYIFVPKDKLKVFYSKKT